MNEHLLAQYREMNMLETFCEQNIGHAFWLAEIIDL